MSGERLVVRQTTCPAKLKRISRTLMHIKKNALAVGNMYMYNCFIKHAYVKKLRHPLHHHLITRPILTAIQQRYGRIIGHMGQWPLQQIPKGPIYYANLKIAISMQISMSEYM